MEAEEAVALVAQVEVALDVDRLAGELLGLAALALALALRLALAIAVAAPAPAPAVAALVVVAVLAALALLAAAAGRWLLVAARWPSAAALAVWPVRRPGACGRRRSPRRRPRRRRRRRPRLVVGGRRRPPTRRAARRPAPAPSAPRRRRRARRRRRPAARGVGGRPPSAAPSPPTPVSSRIRSTMSAFLARAAGLPPSALAMVTSSSRSLRSRAERSRAVESTLIRVVPQGCRKGKCRRRRRRSPLRSGGRSSRRCRMSGRCRLYVAPPGGTQVNLARGPPEPETRAAAARGPARLPARWGTVLEARGLVKAFAQGPRRRRRRPRDRRGRARRAPRAQRRRQDHHAPDAPRRHHPRRRLDHARRPRPAQGPVARPWTRSASSPATSRCPTACGCARRCRSSPASTACAARPARPPSSRASSASGSPTSPTACAWSCRRASARSSAS